MEATAGSKSTFTPKKGAAIMRFMDRLNLIPDEYGDLVLRMVMELMSAEPDPVLERQYNHPRAVELGWRVVK